MVKAAAELMRSSEGLNKMMRGIQVLREHQILVGIPQKKDSRKDEGIGNAELLYIQSHGIRRRPMREEMKPYIDGGMNYSEAYLLYIHEHGSPLWHSPPRPVLEPAIRHSSHEIAEQIAKAVSFALDGEEDKALRQMKRAGMVGQNAARAWFTDPNNGWAPNSPKTIEYKGSDKPLIDTDQMRKAITYVVRDKRGGEL